MAREFQQVDGAIHVRADGRNENAGLYDLAHLLLHWTVARSVVALGQLGALQLRLFQHRDDHHPQVLRLLFCESEALSVSLFLLNPIKHPSRSKTDPWIDRIESNRIDTKVQKLSREICVQHVA